MVVRQNVFPAGPRTAGYERLANGLHVVTRESVIRNALVFQEGEPLASTLQDALSDRPGRQVMARAIREAHLLTLLPDWKHERAILYSLPSLDALSR